MNYVKGFDCAWPQGRIRWDDVPAEYRYVFCQVANGVRGRDPTGPPDLAGVRRTNRYAGVYLFFHGESEPDAQIENLIGACGDTMPHAVWLDFETLANGTSAGVAVDRLDRAIDRVRAWGALPCDVYTFPNFDLQIIGAELLRSKGIHTKANLAIADYSKGENVDGKTPWIVKPWDNWKWWQTSGNNSGFIPGVNGHVDHGVFNGDEAALRQYFGLVDASDQDDPTVIIHPPIDFVPPDPPEE